MSSYNCGDSDRHSIRIVYVSDEPKGINWQNIINELNCGSDPFCQQQVVHEVSDDEWEF